MDALFIVFAETEDTDSHTDIFVAGVFTDQAMAETASRTKNALITKYLFEYNAWCEKRSPMYWKFINSRPIGVGVLTDEEEQQIVERIGPRPELPAGEVYAHHYSVVTVPVNLWGEYSPA